MAIPDRTPFTSYIGLYLSCHQIKAEMDSECGKIFRAHLSDLQSQLSGARIDIPTGFPNMQHIRVLLDREKYALLYSADIHDFMPLCNLQSASITFVSDNTRVITAATFRALRTIYGLVASMEPGNPESVLPVWVQLEMWGGNRQTAAQLISLAVELGEKYRDQLGDWRFHWAMKGGVVQGIWEKQRVSDRSKELDMEEAESTHMWGM
jgi:hypothetical protein